MLKGSHIVSSPYLIKQLPIATVFIDLGYKVVYASDTWVNTYSGIGPDIIGQDLFKIIGKVNHKWKFVLDNCFSGKSNIMGLQRIKDAKGNETWHEWHCSSWYNENENIIGAILHVKDISEIIQNEIELDKKDVLLNQQSEVSKMGRWEYDLLNNRLYWCNMTKKIHEVPLDYTPDINAAIDFYKEGHSQNTISMAIYEATKHGKSWRHKLQIITANGKEKWVLAAGMPIYEDKKMVRLMGIFQDIDDQVAANMEVRKNEKLLRTLVDNLPVNVFVKDLEHRKVLVNKAECRYHGTENEKDLLGKNNFDLYDAQTAQKYTDQDNEVLATMRPILGEEVISLKKDGTQTNFLISKIPLINEKGAPYGLLGISYDITQMKQKELELRNLIHVTSSQNKKLLHFAHIVSHNLRSHSANFSMLLNFLFSETDKDEKARIMSMLTKSSNDLMETLENLNEVLDITSKVRSERKKVNLSAAIDTAITTLKDTIAANNAKIKISVQDNVYIKGIPEYLENILTNFLSNAIKYKHPDRDPVIKLTYRQEHKTKILCIEDNGLGIDLEKYRSKLFGMYKTFHKNSNAKGIGLYITKNQIEAMNGKITVDSKVGEGTQFKVYFDELY